MKVIIANNYGELSEKAAEIFADEIKKNPKSKVGFASGKTPLRFYKILREKKEVDFSKIKAFNLDEYYPINKADKIGFYYYIQKNIIEPLKINNFFLLNGEDNPEEQVKEYKEFIKKPDLIILGVGENGHIAFNEPYSDIKSTSRVVELSEETINKNSGFFSKVPARATTIGIPEILSAKKLILLASGKSKSEAIKELVEGNANYKYPVTQLRKHNDLIVLIDREASERLYLNK